MMDVVYLFRCGEGDLFGLTQEETGKALPSEMCANGAWRLVGRLHFEGGLPPWGIDVAWQDKEAAIQAGLSQNGFFVSERESLPEGLLEAARS
jgi:hypothetical protein